MINNNEFTKRLKKVLEYYQLSASAFAEKIQVQRSSISHLLSGRNKPSLDFVLKVLEEFNDVELYWLLNGKGVFPKKEKNADFPTTLFPESSSETSKIETQKTKKAVMGNLNYSEIEKIVIFYKNGTFKQFDEI